MAKLVYRINDLEHLKEITYNNYLVVRAMVDVPTGIRKKLLEGLFNMNPNAWNVIGITHEALLVFKKYKYKKVSGMGINRSHKISRAEQYKEMLFDNEAFERKYYDKESFWAHYIDGDATILATSSENMKNKFSRVYPIPEESDLFKTRGFAWKHGSEEIDFLKKLWKEVK